MRLHKTATVAALALLLSLGTATTAGASAPGSGPVGDSRAKASAASTLDTANHLMGLRYWDFVNQPQVAPFDWESDGCTGVGTGEKVIFFEACVQHDFGYGNYGPSSGLKLDPTDARRAWIDERFYHEMRQICIDRHESGSTCLGSAKVIYDGVRAIGWTHW
ncbi:MULTISPECIES: phospholipase A2 [unclassified Streptomyces]|uniref:phospholipase A2 n=1 Tax=unclassified Streptomyces TaxID=2593676 RepID=UPI0037A40DF6